jgi:hypothetical protein
MKKLIVMLLIIVAAFVVASGYYSRQIINPLESESPDFQTVANADSEQASEPKAPDVWDGVLRLHSERKMVEVSMDTILKSESRCIRGLGAIKSAREATSKAFGAERDAYSRLVQTRVELLAALRRDRNDKASRRQELADRLKKAENDLQILQERRRNLADTTRSAANGVSADSSIRALDKIIEQGECEVETLNRSLDNLDEVIALIEQRIQKDTDQKELQKKLIDLCTAQAYFYATYYDVLEARLALQCPDEDDMRILDHTLPKLVPTKKFGNSSNSDHDQLR